MQLYRPFGTFRLALATLVVVSHTHVLAGHGDVLRSLSLGNLGVMSFFVLSGYVIAEAINVFYQQRPGAFLLNRALRIFPPFVVALALSVLLHWLVSLQGAPRFFDPVEHPERMFDARNILSNALSLLIPAGLGRLGFTSDYVFVRYAWAVAVELLFYYAMALLLFLSIVPTIRRKMDSKSFWTAAAIAFGLVFLVVQGIMVWVPYFMLGVSLYHFAIGRSRRVLLLAIVSLACVNWHAFEYISRNPVVNVVAAVLLLDLLIVVLWLLSRSEIPQWLVKVDQFCGDLTYPLYLNHYAISIVVISLVPVGRYSLALFLAYVLLAMIFSYLAMQCSEPLTRHLRERIRGRRL